MILTINKKKDTVKDWHKWFAWFPVLVFNDSNIKKYAWLQMIQRKTYLYSNDINISHYREIIKGE